MIWQHIIKITLNHIVIYERKSKLPTKKITSKAKQNHKKSKWGDF